MRGAHRAAFGALLLLLSSPPCTHFAVGAVDTHRIRVKVGKNGQQEAGENSANTWQHNKPPPMPADEDEDTHTGDCAEQLTCLTRCMSPSFENCTAETIGYLSSACTVDPGCSELERVLERQNEIQTTEEMHALHFEFLERLYTAMHHSRDLWFALSACFDGVKVPMCMKRRVVCHEQNTPIGCREMHRCMVQGLTECHALHMLDCEEVCRNDFFACSDDAAYLIEGVDLQAAELHAEVCNTQFSECAHSCTQSPEAMQCLDNSRNGCLKTTSVAVANAYAEVEAVCNEADNPNALQDVLNDCTVQCGASAACQGVWLTEYTDARYANQILDTDDGSNNGTFTGGVLDEDDDAM